MDGGSGRGGQEPGKLRFFLGDGSGAVSVAVNYPSGDSDGAAGVPLGGAFVAVEDTPITLKVGTKFDPDPTFTRELGPATMTWVFRWRTVGIKGDQRQDAVTIENYMGYTSGSSCYLGIEPGAPLVLHGGDSGVTSQVYWNGTDWQHELRWSDLPCAPDCLYRFKVTSGIGNGTTSTGPTRIIPATSFCLPDAVPNEP